MHVTEFDNQIAQTLAISNPDGLAVVDRNLKYVAWNSALSKISGLTAAEAIGRNVFDLFPFLESLGERDIHRRVFKGETVVADPRPYSIPEKGRRGHFQSQYWPWRNDRGEIIGIFMSIRDVGRSFNRLLFLSELSSALSQATSPQQTLDISLDFLKRSTNAERGLVVLLTEDKQEIEVVALNSAGTSIADRERLGIHFDIPLTVAIRNNRPVFSPDAADALKFSKRHVDYVKATGDVAAAAVPLIIEGEIIGGIAVSYKQAQQFTDEDASYWIAASNLCAQSYSRAVQFEKERAARAAAENASRAKSRFLANLSHELRTPLTVVIGHAELIRSELVKAAKELPKDFELKLGKYAERCFNHGVMLARILEDILDLTKIEVGTIAIKKEAIVVDDWLEDIVSIATQLTADKPIQVKLIRHAGLPLKIGTDSLRAKQILLNLVSNASKFTDSGEIVIEAKGKMGCDRKDILVITVKDTGIGIEPARHTVIFDAFEKTMDSKNDRGQGLGLTIATQLASALGGSVRLIESAKDQGATFELTLPDLGTDQPNAITTSRAHIDQRTLKDKVILIADDDDMILEYLSDLLKSASGTVYCANNGAEAIEYALEKKPDVVILDLQMPVINGFQAAAQIRESVPGVPILALSAHGLREHRDLARESGFTKFLVKPVDLATLANSILSVTSV